MPSTPEPSLLCQITIHHFTKLKESNEYLNLLKIIYRSLLKVRNSCHYICHYPQVFTLHFASDLQRNITKQGRNIQYIAYT